MRHWIRITWIPSKDGNPINRLLVAQARAERMTLLTDDQTLDGHEVFVEVV
jgi:PIN domain nuclease of toxin-antitoxin system